MVKTIKRNYLNVLLEYMVKVLTARCQNRTQLVGAGKTDIYYSVYLLWAFLARGQHTIEV